MCEATTIYVRLLDESVEVWRPVHAVEVRPHVYEILPQPYDRELELWEFDIGDRVVCEQRPDAAMVAIDRAGE